MMKKTTVKTNVNDYGVHVWRKDLLLDQLQEIMPGQMPEQTLSYNYEGKELHKRRHSAPHACNYDNFPVLDCNSDTSGAAGLDFMENIHSRDHAIVTPCHSSSDILYANDTPSQSSREIFSVQDDVFQISELEEITFDDELKEESHSIVASTNMYEPSPPTARFLSSFFLNEIEHESGLSKKQFDDNPAMRPGFGTYKNKLPRRGSAPALYSQQADLFALPCANESPRLNWRAPSQGGSKFHFDAHANQDNAALSQIGNDFNAQANQDNAAFYTEGPLRWEGDWNQLLCNNITPSKPSTLLHPIERNQEDNSGASFPPVELPSPPRHDSDDETSLSSPSDHSDSDVTLVTSLLKTSHDSLVTKFTSKVFRELEFGSFSESDRKGNRKNIPTGFPGLSCRHCKGVGRTGRYFPSSIKSFADSKKTLFPIFNHLMTCSSYPQASKDRLSKLHRKHKIVFKKKGKYHHGSQRVFYRQIWNKLHPSEDKKFNTG